MLMGPDAWREAIKPHLARVVKFGRKRGMGSGLLTTLVARSVPSYPI